MKTVLLIVGAVVFLAGLLFAGQGAGLIHWPQTSMMLGSKQWVTYGLVIAAVGLLMVVMSTRRSH